MSTEPGEAPGSTKPSKVWSKQRRLPTNRALTKAVDLAAKFLGLRVSEGTLEQQDKAVDLAAIISPEHMGEVSAKAANLGVSFTPLRDFATHKTRPTLLRQGLVRGEEIMPPCCLYSMWWEDTQLCLKTPR